jgi:hypothetical protein
VVLAGGSGGGVWGLWGFRGVSGMWRSSTPAWIVQEAMPGGGGVPGESMAGCSWVPGAGTGPGPLALPPTPLPAPPLPAPPLPAPPLPAPPLPAPRPRTCSACSSSVSRNSSHVMPSTLPPAFSSAWWEAGGGGGRGSSSLVGAAVVHAAQSRARRPIASGHAICLPRPSGLPQPPPPRHLVDGHGADGHRGVAHHPVARLVDVGA